MRHVAFTVFLILIPLVVVAKAGRVVRFPANQQYGYLLVPDSTHKSTPMFQVVRVMDAAGDSVEVLKTVPSLPLPCSPNAVSYLSLDRDSSHLMVFDLDSPEIVDTVLSCASPSSPEARGASDWPRKDRTRVVGLVSYYFLLKDSILVWQPPLGIHCIPVEIGHIRSDGAYQYDMEFINASIGRPDLNYTEILIVESPPHLMLSPADTIIYTISSYSTSHGGLSPIAAVPSHCWDVGRRTPGDTVWCLAHTGDIDINLYRVEESRLVPVTAVECPVKIANYRLYPDHLEIDTVICCGDSVTRKE